MWSLFRKKTDRELEDKLAKEKEKRINLEKRADLRDKIRQERELSNKARAKSFGSASASKAVKGALKAVDSIGKHIAKNIAADEKMKKKGMGMSGHSPRYLVGMDEISAHEKKKKMMKKKMQMDKDMKGKKGRRIIIEDY